MNVKRNTSRQKNQKSPNQPLIDARIHQHWTQQEVADRLGTTFVNVSRWENRVNSPNRYFRTKLCELFGKTAQELGLLPPAELPEKETSASEMKTTLFDSTIPHLLAETHDLVGCDELLSSLKQRLFQKKTVALTALNGLPGVGKTALAVTLAHDPGVQQYFHNGVLWAGLGPHPQIIEMLSRWGVLLGMAPGEKLSNQEAWANALRTLMGERHLLLVIDDAWQIDHALAFKVGGPHCAYLVTTRFPGLAFQFAGEAVDTVHELDEEHSLALLARLAPTIVTNEPDEARKLVQLVGGLPLALMLMGKALQRLVRRGQPRRVQSALRKLQQAEERLRLTEDVATLERPPNLAGTSLSLQATIEVSDQQLNEQARCALRTLSVFPARPNSFSEEAALAVCNMPVEVLDILADSGLLESTAPQRYTLHQTIFDYARMDGPERAAEERMAGYFMRHVEAYVTDYETLEQETHNVLVALDIAHERGFLTPLIRTANAFYQFLSIRGLYDLAELHLKRAEEAARTAEYGDGLAKVLFHLGDCKFYRDEYDQAEALWTEGLALARQSESVDLLCLFLRKLGAMQLNLGHTAEAMSYLQEGLGVAQQMGDKKIIGSLLRTLGRVVSNLSGPQQAELYYQEGLALARQIEDRPLICQCLLSLGGMFYITKDFPRAEVFLQEGLALARQIGFKSEICHFLVNLGSMASDLGNHELAQGFLQEGLALAQQAMTKVPFLNNLGLDAYRCGKYKQAAVYFQKGLTLARTMGNAYYIANVLNNYGELNLKQEDSIGVAAKFQEALDVLEGAPGMSEERGSALFGLARVRLAQGKYEEARHLGQESLAIFEAIEYEKDKAVEIRQWLHNAFSYSQ